MEIGVEYAVSAQQAYLKALRGYSILPATTPYAAIPLGAAALGLGITGAAAANPITALGLAAGTGLAVGTWAQNKPREAAYNLGYKAITCLLQSVEPLRPADPKALREAIFGGVEKIVGSDGKEVERRKTSLAEARNQLQKDIETLENSITGAQGLSEEQKKVLGAFVDQAKQHFTDTQVIEEDGTRLAALVQGAGVALVNNVDVIVGRINDAVRETTPNVQAAASVISGLSVVQSNALAALRPPAAPTGKADATKAKIPPPSGAVAQDAANTAVNRAVDAVDHDLDGVLSLAAVVRAHILASRAANSPTVASCLALPDSLSLTPVISEQAVKLRQGASRRVVVAGGKPPYFATVLAGPAKKEDLTADAKMDGGVFVVELNVSKDCPPTTADGYRVRVADSTGAGGSIAVTVEVTTAALTVTPAQLTLGAKDKVSFSITGGTPPYQVTPAGNLGSIQVSSGVKDPKAQAYTVDAGDAPTPGSLIVRDKSDPPQTVVVEIKFKGRNN